MAQTHVGFPWGTPKMQWSRQGAPCPVRLTVTSPSPSPESSTPRQQTLHPLEASNVIFLPELQRKRKVLVDAAMTSVEREEIPSAFYQDKVFAYWVDDAVDAGNLRGILCELGGNVLTEMKALYLGVGLAGGRKGLVEVVAGTRIEEIVGQVLGQDDEGGYEGMAAVNGFEQVMGGLEQPGFKVIRTGGFGGVGKFEAVERWVLVAASRRR